MTVDLAYYATDEDVLPSAARQMWASVGPGGTLTAANLQIVATTQLNYYWRQAVQAEFETAAKPQRVSRLEIQARFSGVSNGSGDVSGHMLVLDDGERAVGVALGNSLAFVDPATGDTLRTIVASWGFARATYYTLVKLGTEAWEIYADGRLLGRLGYEAAATAFLPAPGYAWGWFDAATSGTGDWQSVEAGMNTVLPPQWQVDRIRTSMPAPMQTRWTRRHTALVRAMVGTTEIANDASRRAFKDLTGGVVPWEQTAFDGATDPVRFGWTEQGAAFPGSIVRERANLPEDVVSHWWQYDFATPNNPTDFVAYLRARVHLRDFHTASPEGRVGAFLQVQNGHRQIGVYLVHDLSQPEALGWILSDGALAGSLSNTGEHTHFANPEGFDGTLVELYITGRDRVILFLDEQLVEDLPYSTFTTVSANFRALVGRSSDTGGGAFSATVDFEDVESWISYADLHQRPLFLNRLNERLLFSGGCERNDTLEAWSRHRPGVFKTRGTDRVLSEIRRVSCDDSAALVVSTTPGEWYLELTYPEVTPIFLELDAVLSDTVVEVQANAPNFTADQLGELIRYYLIPRSLVEASFDVAVATPLTAPTVTMSPTVFTVENPTGFAAGDEVTLRGSALGPIQVPNQLEGTQGIPLLVPTGSPYVGLLTGFRNFTPTDNLDANANYLGDSEPFKIFAWRVEWTTQTPTHDQPLIGRDGDGGLSVYIRFDGPAPGTTNVRYRDDSGIQRMAESLSAPPVRVSDPLGTQWWVLVQVDLRSALTTGYVGGDIFAAPVNGTGAGIGIATGGGAEVTHFMTAGHAIGFDNEQLANLSCDEMIIHEFREYDSDGDTFAFDSTSFGNMVNGNDYEANMVRQYLGFDQDAPNLSLAYNVGHEQTDQGIRDLSGNGRHGTLGAAGTLRNAYPDSQITPSAPGATQGAVENTAFTPDLAGGTVTIALWVQWDDGTDRFLWSTLGTADGGIQLRVDGSNDLELTIINSGGSTQVVTYVSAVAASAGDWVHIAVRIDTGAGAAAIKTFVDGTEINTGAALTVTPDTPTVTGFRVGADDSSASNWTYAYRDVWCWDRAVSDSDITALAAGTRVAAPRDFWNTATADQPEIVWLPLGYHAAWARWDRTVEQAEYVRVASQQGEVWAYFEATADGEQGRGFTGTSLAITGLASTRANDVTPGNTVTADGDATVTGTVTVYGIRTSDGLPGVEELSIAAGVAAVGTVQWDEVHGASIDAVQTAVVEVTDTGDSDLLYQIQIGETDRGVRTFDPAWRAGPSAISMVSDFTLTNSLLLRGHVEGSGVEELNEEQFSISDVTSETYVSLQAIALGYITISAAVTFEGAFSNPASVFRVFSSDAADTMPVHLVYVDSDGVGRVETLTLDGTTSVDGTANPFRFLGAVLSGTAAPTGTITVRMFAADVQITVGTIGAGKVLGGRRLQMDMENGFQYQIGDTLAFPDSIPTWVGFVGLDVNGEVQAEAVLVSDTDWRPNTLFYSRLLGICTADLPDTTYVRIRGKLWRYGDMNTLIRERSADEVWAATTAVSTLDSRLTPDPGQDASEGDPLTYTATGSKTEDTTITTIDQTTGVVSTSELTESFDIGDVMRKGI